MERGGARGSQRWPLCCGGGAAAVVAAGSVKTHGAKGGLDSDKRAVLRLGERGRGGAVIDHGVGDGRRDRHTRGADAEAGGRRNGQLDVEATDHDGNSIVPGMNGSGGGGSISVATARRRSGCYEHSGAKDREGRGGDVGRCHGGAWLLLLMGGKEARQAGAAGRCGRQARKMAATSAWCHSGCKTEAGRVETRQSVNSIKPGGPLRKWPRHRPGCSAGPLLGCCRRKQAIHRTPRPSQHIRHYLRGRPRP